MGWNHQLYVDWYFVVRLVMESALPNLFEISWRLCTVEWNKKGANKTPRPRGFGSRSQWLFLTHNKKLGNPLVFCFPCLVFLPNKKQVNYWRNQASHFQKSGWSGSSMCIFSSNIRFKYHGFLDIKMEDRPCILWKWLLFLQDGALLGWFAEIVKLNGLFWNCVACNNYICWTSKLFILYVLHFRTTWATLYGQPFKSTCWISWNAFFFPSIFWPSRNW